MAVSMVIPVTMIGSSSMTTTLSRIVDSAHPINSKTSFCLINITGTIEITLSSSTAENPIDDLIDDID
ncbi:hypothetical protein NDU88_001275 [Pleurodeles waltl]|uniref:Secreted protein n=1 Tax=Pleurodeles waltl TaxID=8319 RepID=A0AAV7MLA2_PLEWA|nr:hypothetical protein NDU88_001275 [Pleurodeles waltl]